jgi:hypothetical protein
MSEYENRRARKIARNQALLKELQLESASNSLNNRSLIKVKTERPAKRRKLSNLPARHPLRASARIASSETRPVYSEEKLIGKRETSGRNATGKQLVAVPEEQTPVPAKASKRTAEEIEELRAKWSSWEPSADPPTRDSNGTFHFDDNPDFVPNKSPAEVLREGCFGGTYFRPLYSATLKTEISGDWHELPVSWIEGLNIHKYLTSTVYDPQVNKYGVTCGQSIEEWEANGWINHDYDVRGWFQWYCRFFTGRRCEDDGRQIGRWKKCVGEKGRWRRTLLKVTMKSRV